MYKRFKWQEKISWYPPAWDLVDTLKKPSRVFVGSTFELFHESLPYNWMEYNLLTAKKYPQHTFIFLTKQPQNLIKFSPFSDNCWVGVTATNDSMFRIACANLAEVQAKMKYISFEPLLDWSNYFSTCGLKEDNSLGDNWMKHAGIKWVINGAMTGSLEDIKKMLMVYPQLTPMPWGKRWTLQPKIEWVEEIEKACNKAGIPVFEKNNLSPLLDYNLRQEMPK
jgi:protein gp37